MKISLTFICLFTTSVWAVENKYHIKTNDAGVQLAPLQLLKIPDGCHISQIGSTVTIVCDGGGSGDYVPFVSSSGTYDAYESSVSFNSYMVSTQTFVPLTADEYCKIHGHHITDRIIENHIGPNAYCGICKKWVREKE